MQAQDANHRSGAFHLQLNQEIDESVLESMLRKAGIPLAHLRAVTPLNKGVSVTILLAEGEWDQTTGAASCAGHCPPEAPHVRYQNLNREQKAAFHQDLTSALDYYRANNYDPSDSEIPEPLHRVALSPCDQ